MYKFTIHAIAIITKTKMVLKLKRSFDFDIGGGIKAVTHHFCIYDF